jgi:transposase
VADFDSQGCQVYRGLRAMAGEYWLTDAGYAAIEPLLPAVYSGARRKDDRRIISGIIHVLRSGCRWQDCPAIYGPSTTVYNRFNRWSRRGLWHEIFEALVETAPNDTRSIDSTSIKVQRAAAGGKGGPKRKQSASPAVAGARKSTPSQTVKGDSFDSP